MIKLNNFIKFKMSPSDKEKLLYLDKEYGDLINMYRTDRNWKEVHR